MTMKYKINSRIELLLAKIAGHDVDIKTMTPPVESTAVEEILSEIADIVKTSMVPPVTSDDDGAVLTVVDGEWTKSNVDTEQSEV